MKKNKTYPISRRCIQYIHKRRPERAPKTNVISFREFISQRVSTAFHGGNQSQCPEPKARYAMKVRAFTPTEIYQSFSRARRSTPASSSSLHTKPPRASCFYLRIPIVNARATRHARHSFIDERFSAGP